MANDPEGPFDPVVGATDQVLTYAKVDVVADGTYYFVVEAHNAKGSTASEVYSIEGEDRTDRIPAFPGAEGGGKFTTGGRAHEVYKVTTLEDYVPGEEPIEGSLRHALSEGNRNIVFDVSGTIYLKADLGITSNNITIDRKSTRLNSSHVAISYAVFCLKKKKEEILKRKLPGMEVQLGLATE